MSVTAERPTRTARAVQVLADRRSSGTLPSHLHVLLDIGVADDCARVRATLAAFAAFGDVSGIPVHLGTAGGPRCVGRLDAQRLERVARHLGAFARGFDGAPVLSRAIARTGSRHPRLARLLGARPMAVLVTTRPPADRVATARALRHSARRGLPWLVVTATPGVDDTAFDPSLRSAPDAVAVAVTVAEVTDLGERPDTLVRAILEAWDRTTGVEA